MWYNGRMNNDKKRIITALALLGSCFLVSLGLAIAKTYVGLRSNSLVIMLDGINSFFDVATGVVTLVAFGLLLAPRTERRPYGFGRGEYLAGFVVAAVTMVMGVVFLMRSLTRLAMPEPVYYRTSSMIIISVALAVKIGMTVAYFVVNRKVRSHALRSLSVDSVLDVGMTAASVACFTAAQATGYAIDAWLGIAVAIVVMALGAKLVYDNAKLLLGAGDVTAEKVRTQEVLSHARGIDKVLRITLADYGYRLKVGHAEVVFDPALSAQDIMALAKDVETALTADGVYLYVVPRDAN